MTRSSQYRGLPVSEGVASGLLYPGDAPGDAQQGTARPATPEVVRDAFAAVARERSELAQRLRERGRDDQAEIVVIGALIAADPALVDPAVAAVRDGTGAAAAVERSADAQAAALAALADPDLAARADDVRQVANAVLAHLAGNGVPPPPASGFILVRREVDPADLIRFAETGLAGAVSVGGGASSHAAIIARGLGVPMLAGADPAVLAAPAGHPAILDAAAGRLIVDPTPRQQAAVATRAQATPANGMPGPAPRDCSAPAAVTPARTADGQQVTLLCNVASAAETRLGLAAGAAGVGLLRTEIPFAGAADWPTQAQHEAVLGPVLSLLAGRPAVVRLLDFSGDKVPAFLAGREAGLTALIRHPRALRDQLRAILRTGRDTRLSVMVPMVGTLDEMALVRTALMAAAAEVGTEPPELGMMVEVASTAAAAQAFATSAGFFSIGTNDLTSQVLGLDRGDPRMRPDLAADPRVLALISHVVRAAGAAGVKVSVCGDAAADPAVLPLLIGLGVRTLSMGAARLRPVADWIATADTSVCAALAASALRAPAAGPVGAL
jgi:phosphoenolpyruvate-protein kinase (PTS system EI component)